MAVERRDRRAFVVVIDACGAGEVADSGEYGDAGCDTLAHLAEVTGGLRLPTLGGLGLGCIKPLRGVSPVTDPVIHGRLAPQGLGKDSKAGHWELMGVVTSEAPPVYPDGFPAEVVELIGSVAGRGVLGNRPSNGLEVIEQLGEQSVREGALILYTSQDSVLQLAAHHDVVGPGDLHYICRQVRERLPPEHAVGRVIARPFTGPPGAYERTHERRDFASPPPTRSYLQELSERRVPVHSVGKVAQLFAGVGIDHAHAASDNARGLRATGALVDDLPHGLVFTNLIDTDQVHGHRHDAEGFHAALREIDANVGHWLDALGPEDLLIITADHGCDVTAPHTDHTREHVPLLARVAGRPGHRHDGAMADVGASVLDWLTGATAPGLPGSSFVGDRA